MAPIPLLLLKILVSVGANKAVNYLSQPKGNSIMETVLGLIRHLLTAGGGALAAKGYIDAGTVETVVGAVLTLIGAAWSVYNKKKETPEA